jgi:DNA helicase-2/ATP-dependent DNA helicase PcrA
MVADEIEKAKRAGRRYNQMAILVRASFQMRAFEERFVMLQIPYKVVGGPRFFERAEIRDAHAYLRLIQSPDDDLAFERIVNTPKRGIGDTSVQKLLQIARLEGISTVEAARVIIGSDDLPARTRTALSNFIRDLDRWRAQIGNMHHQRVLEMVLEESGYTDALRLDKGPQSQTRLENLKELVQSMGQFDSLEAYLEHVSLVMDLDREATGDAVWIMTLHSAKGLEFPLVFLPGWEEGVFPSQRSMDDKGEKGLEEERRLAYVGITRAREEARISFVANRQVYGRWTSQLPSRFVDELPLEHVDAGSETGYYGGGPGMQQTVSSRWDDPGTSAFQSGSYDSPGWKRAQDRVQQTSRGFAERGGGHAAWRGGGSAARARPIEGEGRLVAVSAPTNSAYSRGDRVFHVKFGYGHVASIEGNKLTVNFDKAGEKKVIDSFVEKA